MYPPSVRRAALERLSHGATLSQVSRETGISRSALRSWRIAGAVHDSRTLSCPRCGGFDPDAAAYAALLGFYLGDGCISAQRRCHIIRISCDAVWPGVIEDVSATLRRVHPARPVHHVRAPGVVVCQSAWQHWPCLFPQHGPGRKHERSIQLSDWQRDLVVAQPGHFLRGLFHSDGSRVANWATRVVGGERRRYDYPRWQFTNASEDILGLCTWALDLVDISWRRSHTRRVSVSRRESVARLDAMIGLKS